MNKTLILLALFSTTTLAADPILLSAVSRKVHGAAGTFDIALSEVVATVEPRAGPNHAVVFTFDRAITEAECYLAEGAGTMGAAIIDGRDVTCPLALPYNGLWVGYNVVVTDGTGFAEALVRVGYLLGDVNGTGVVTVADVGLVNAQIVRPVTAANFRADVNANGALTLSDRLLTNAQVTRALPPQP